MTDLLFHSIFIASKVGATGLTVTVDVDKIERATGTRTAVVTAGSATEGRNGHYYYRHAGVTDLTTFDYVACFKTADATVDTQHIHSGWMDFPTAYDAQLTQLDDLPTATEIDSALSVSHGSGLWGGAGGTGAIDWSDNFIVTVDGSPRDGVSARFTTDAAGVNAVASGVTNSFGKLDSLMLDAGTYYVWLQLAGVNFTSPDVEVVA